MPFAGLVIRAEALYPNVNTTACFLVPFVSRTHVLIFSGTVIVYGKGLGRAI